MSDTAEKLRRALADTVGSAGWRTALEEVPRELFIGDAVLLGDAARGDPWTAARRTDMDEDEWLRLVYTDGTWVTQVDGVLAEQAADATTGSPSSSSTTPSLVVRMLEAAQIGEDDRVLEIGTGTGYSTALMCHRLDDKAVTSIEYDDAVAERARKAIAAAGYAPTLVVGDGLRGHPDGAPYDRLIGTCSVRTIPPAWMDQIRVGGTITTPTWGWMGGVAFAHLTLTGDGEASGRFLPDDLYFMRARSHMPPPRPPVRTGVGDARETRVDPAILDDEAALFVAQLAAPAAQRASAGDTTILLDVATGSRADTRPNPGGGWTVHQHGPLRLWDAVEDAILLWQDAGSPHQSAFGLTVTGDGQHVWLGEPGGLCWDLPA
ncbi:MULTISPECIES: ATP-grasp peptide maturase system methyltransferase [Streptosporangium]|uniref:Protein-L-isoaspartate O-methyltransferase n=1 Tax=Streptosporangium brasiliense TaxID=47480 RepID=A0ABT9RLU3_9ACTN|nr:ATP-grasp peptide maturase system methyltransferase [Streptosporangium brasiliense]MDP9870225.1 methyltransferase of ATP-grasp peptide maturase system [Streptosporangium brasiliense]